MRHLACKQVKILLRAFSTPSPPNKSLNQEHNFDISINILIFFNVYCRYYFRVQNMVPGATYKFNIINLLKKDSLYNYGTCRRFDQ